VTVEERIAHLEACPERATVANRDEYRCPHEVHVTGLELHNAGRTGRRWPQRVPRGPAAG
jgi:hypothetical protein